MRPTTVGMLLVIMVTAGLWSQKKFLSVQHAMAAGIFTIFLTVIFQIDKEFGKALSVLALVAVGWIYIVPLVAQVEKSKSIKTIPPNPMSAGQNPPFIAGLPGSTPVPNQQKQDDWRDFMLPGWRN